MVEYKCDKCNKTYTQKIDYTRHLNRKNPCIPEQKEVIVYACGNCKKHFLNNYNMKRHMKKCTVQPSNDINTNNNNNSANDINGDHNTIDNSITNNITNNVNIQLLPFGKENVSKIKNSTISKILKTGYSSPSELNKEIHFNEAFPENHNVYITNLKDEYAKVYEGVRWIVRNRSEVIDEIINRRLMLLEQKHKEFKKNNKYNMNHPLYKGFLKLMDDIKNEVKETDKRLINDLELQLYNNRYMPIETSKKLKKK